MVNVRYIWKFYLRPALTGVQPTSPEGSHLRIQKLEEDERRFAETPEGRVLAAVVSLEAKGQTERTTYQVAVEDKELGGRRWQMAMGTEYLAISRLMASGQLVRTRSATGRIIYSTGVQKHAQNDARTGGAQA